MDNNINLYNEDCMEVLKRLPDNSVDLIVTDPPYLIEKSSGGGSMGHKAMKVYDELDGKNLMNGFGEEVLQELVRVCKGVNIYLFC